MADKKNHVHKYLRVIHNKPPGYTVFKCVIPGCAHSLRKELMIARECICWRCGGVMILGTPDVEMKKPRHFECRRVIKAQEGIEGGNDATITTET
jgi:hypothetical protein